MKEDNKVKLGMFLLISLLLLVGTFLAAGINKLFEPKLRAMTVLNTSVEGMSVGSPVKYLGMSVGKITGLAMRAGSGLVVVYFDLFANAVEDDFAGNTDGVFDKSDLDMMLKKQTISCFVNAAGLMGGTFLELSIAPHEHWDPPAKIRIPEGVSYIPSQPSHIGNAIQNVSKLLEEIKGIDFNKFSVKLNHALDNLTTLTERGRLDHTLDLMNRSCVNLEEISRRLERTASPENLDRVSRIIVSLDRTSKNFLDFSSKREFSETLFNINKFIRDICGFLVKMEGTTSEVSNSALTLQQRLDSTLTRLENFLQQVSQQLADLGDDPAQFLHGRSPR